LVELPNKFRKLVWIKPGDYVLIEKEDNPKGALAGGIAAVLYKRQIEQLRKEGHWYG